VSDHPDEHGDDKEKGRADARRQEEDRPKEKANNESCIRYQAAVDGPEQAADDPADPGDAAIEQEEQRCRKAGQCAAGK